MSTIDDFRMLRELTTKADELDAADDEEGAEFLFPENARNAFRQMLGRNLPLTDKQCRWVRGVYEKVFQTPIYENLVSSGKAPRGREVKLIVDSMPKPLRPPKRRSE